MNRFLLFIVVAMMATTTTNAQIFDSIGVISPGNEIRDLAVKGSTLYAAVGQGGVWYSNDEGSSWTACSTFPDVGFGQEGAFSIHAASNGDLIVGGNLLYNNAPLGGAVFRSSDDGATWTGQSYEGLAGYEESGKIVELSNGDLMMQGGFQKLFISSLSDPSWTQTNAPGGVIFGFEQINNIIFVVNNPAGGTAGTWTTTDMGQSWWSYGGNGTPVGSGTVTMAPIINSGDYKFIGIGGTYDPRGMYRSGVNDTLWIEKNNGISESGIYPICMATDHVTNWMVMQNVAGTCMFTSTGDFGENWEAAIPGLPNSGGASPCPEKMIVFGADLYTYSNQSVYRKEDVAIPVSVSEQILGDNSIVIYPNPATDQLHARFNNSIDNGNWEILNLCGQVIATGQLSATPGTSLTIDLGNMEAGFYMLSINVGSETQTQKFVKR